MKLSPSLLCLCALLLAGCDRSAEPSQPAAVPDAAGDSVQVEIDPNLSAIPAESGADAEPAAVREEPAADAAAAESSTPASATAVIAVSAGSQNEQVPVLVEADLTPLSDVPPLQPLPGLTEAAPDPGVPELVQFTTEVGDFVIAVYPQAAPNAAERFLHLVEIGYYDKIPVSRVVTGFIAQFGINWRPDYRQWRYEKFADDPSRFAFEPGTLAFAKAGPDTASTQVFINYANNNELARPQYGFAVFGQVIQGMAVVQSFKSVGDPSDGLNQNLLWDGGQAYLNYLDDKPNMILTARRLTSRGQPPSD